MFFSVEPLISEKMLTIILAQNLESYFVFAKTGHRGPHSEALTSAKVNPLPNLQEADDFQTKKHHTKKQKLWFSF